MDLGSYQVIADAIQSRKIRTTGSIKDIRFGFQLRYKPMKTITAFNAGLSQKPQTTSNPDSSIIGVKSGLILQPHHYKLVALSRMLDGAVFAFWTHADYLEGFILTTSVSPMLYPALLR